jgi:endogenous inhibitor of DNA gyrase (YacG/DUF329 family)
MAAPDDPSNSNVRPAGVRVGSASCARCGKPVEARFRPFCSQRCADIDLGAWMTGGYRVETNEAPADADPNTTDPKTSA